MTHFIFIDFSSEFNLTIKGDLKTLKICYLTRITKVVSD